jgi:hypothetical protein
MNIFVNPILTKLRKSSQPFNPASVETEETRYIRLYYGSPFYDHFTFPNGYPWRLKRVNRNLP